ncbi:MAG: hypothetical protein VB050_00800 [Geobacteraceae bacterium]|nr:hypothetical protein [Geobacteraceae bacterium]
MEDIQAIEGLYEVRKDGHIIDARTGKVLKQYPINGGRSPLCVSIEGKDGVRRHVPVKKLLARVGGECKPFDTGVEPNQRFLCENNQTSYKNATNDELVKRQLGLIAPLLSCKDEEYLVALSHLLKAGLGNRKVPC